MRVVIEDIIYKTDHADTRAECAHEPIEGIDLMDIPQLECIMLYKKRRLATCIMNVNSSAQRVRKLTAKEGTCLEEEG